MSAVLLCLFFFLNDTATTEIYTLSLHDALPIWNSAALRAASWSSSIAPRTACSASLLHGAWRPTNARSAVEEAADDTDRKSTRLNSSHLVISYAVFCLKNKIRLLHSVTHPLTIH